MKPENQSALIVPLWPGRSALVFILWPCVGVSLAVGATAYTVALVVSEIPKLDS
jgi:hypothetical protein